MLDNNISGLQKKHRILIVEDDEDCAFTLTHILKKTYDIVHFFNAEDALSYLDGTKISLILMDIGLKGMNGIEALKIIRKKSGYENVPVIAVSAYAMNGDREIFLEEGFNFYVSKPFNLQEVKSLVDGIIDSPD